MTISLFDLALKILINAAIGVALLGDVGHGLRRGYAVGLFWDFQRDSEPIRFWVHLVIFAAAGLGAFWVAVRNATQLTNSI